jgi:hypothetical protein
MKLFAILSLLILVSGCDQKARQDAAALDSLLATGRIDHFEGFGIMKGSTNGYYDNAAKHELRLFEASNRVQTTSQMFYSNSPARIVFYSGTNAVGILRYGGSEVFAFHDYYFRFKSETNRESFWSGSRRFFLIY